MSCAKDCFRRQQTQNSPPATLAFQRDREAEIGAAVEPCEPESASAFRVRVTRPELRIVTAYSSINMANTEELFPRMPFLRGVGIHDFTFQACSSFTRVTACRVARPPCVAFVTRLRRTRLAGRAACQLPDSPTSICVGLPPTGDLRRWGALRNLG